MTATATARIGPTDAEEFTALYHQHRNMVAGIIRGIVHRPNDLEDILQDVFLLAFSRRDQFEGRSGYGTWLHRIAVNQSFAFLRRLAVRKLYLEGDTRVSDNLPALEEAMDSGPSAYALACESERAVRNTALVSRIMGSLPPNYREPIRLEYFEDMSNRDGSAAMGISEVAYKLRLMRARRLMRERAIGMGATA